MIPDSYCSVIIIAVASIKNLLFCLNPLIQRKGTMLIRSLAGKKVKSVQ